MKAIILAAGMGRRLGQGLPKCLTPLDGSMSILDLQLASLRQLTSDIRIVVGYRHELVTSQYPTCSFVHNTRFATTNTAVSLAMALEDDPNDDVLWVNGDVVFSHDVLKRVVEGAGSRMAARPGIMGEEEVKYRTDAAGQIVAVSKTIPDGQGEAVGINLVRAGDVSRLRAGLQACSANDYFERGIEHAIATGLRIFATEVGDLPCMEVDFPEDLDAARKLLPRCLSAIPA